VNGVAYLPVEEDEIVLAVPATHRFAARGEIRLNELAGESFIERGGGSGTQLTVRRFFDEHGLAIPEHHTAMVLGSAQAIASAVERGHGVGWVSSRGVAGRSRERLAVVRLAGLPIMRTIYLAYDTTRQLPIVALAFIEAVRARSGTPLPNWVSEALER
jgi:DNA-binding transcriptional LysR family regulator